MKERPIPTEFRLSSLIFVVVMTMALLACETMPEPTPLVGRWELEPAGNVTMTFSKDGTAVFRESGDDPLKMEGTWKRSGDVIELSVVTESATVTNSVQITHLTDTRLCFEGLVFSTDQEWCFRRSD